MEQLIKDTNITETHVAFWGGPFSNFATCTIEAEGHTFRSSEQYFMWQKAVYFRDDVIAQAILDAKSPAQAKKLGRRVDGFNNEDWDKVKLNAMFNAVYLKFKQNENFKDLLLMEDIMDKDFVEGSPIDKIWGVGIAWDSPLIEDEGNWLGENLLGKILNSVRAALLKEKSTD